jgi:hypothetical protein
MLLDVVNVEPKSDYTLFLKFENGEYKSFDMSLCIDQKPWVKLKDVNMFLKAFVQNGTVVWPGDIDIDPETLYEYSQALEETT